MNAQGREGGGCKSRVVQCAHFAEERWAKVTFTAAQKACKAGLKGVMYQ